MKHGLNVLVIAARDSQELKTLRKSQPYKHLSIITGIHQDIIKRFSPSDKIGTARIHNGRISARSMGGVLPQEFFRGKEVK